MCPLCFICFDIVLMFLFCFCFVSEKVSHCNMRCDIAGCFSTYHNVFGCLWLIYPHSTHNAAVTGIVRDVQVTLTRHLVCTRNNKAVLELDNITWQSHDVMLGVAVCHMTVSWRKISVGHSRTHGWSRGWSRDIVVV